MPMNHVLEQPVAENAQLKVYAHRSQRLILNYARWISYYHHTIIRAAFVCLCVRNQSPPRSFDGSSPNLVGVCRLT